MDLKKFIRDVPDFPKAGILFRDISPLLGEPRAFAEVVDRFGSILAKEKPSAIVGIESRGFIFGAPLALRLGVPFVPVRKPGKLPAEKMSIEYSLEYGSGQLDIHRDAIAARDRVVIVDDLLATGGTAAAAAKLVELIGGVVVKMLFVIELEILGGREKLAPYSVEALISY